MTFMLRFLLNLTLLQSSKTDDLKGEMKQENTGGVLTSFPFADILQKAREFNSLAL